MARNDSEHQKPSMSLLFRGRAIFKPLNTVHIDERMSCVREWVANIFFDTKNGTTIMVDAGCNYPGLSYKDALTTIPNRMQEVIFTERWQSNETGL